MSLRESQLADTLTVPAERLRWCCAEEQLEFESTAEVEPQNGIIGQADAIESLRFGLELFAPGQNVFVRGLSGTGRTSLVRRVLEEIQAACPLSSDYLYAADFEEPAEPRLLTLPRGTALPFRDAVDELIRFLRKDLAPALGSEELMARRQFLDERFEGEAKELSRPFEEELARNGLSMVSVKVGQAVRPAILPLIDGEPAPPEKLQQLVAQGRLSKQDLEDLDEKVSTWMKRLEGLSLRLREISTRHAKEARELFRNETRALIGDEVQNIRASFPSESVGRFLDDVVEDVLRRGIEDLQASPELARRYRVNPIGAHRPDQGCPVIEENTPTLGNLLGSIDRRVLPDGAVVSDHLMIQAGSILRADGGYLILEAREVLREPGAWKVLVRTLRTGKLEIVPPEFAGPWSTRTLKPEPIPVRLKVILIGDPGLYYQLDALDADFPHLFKVLADFDSEIPRNPDGVRQYARLLARIAAEESLPHFSRCAVSALAEHGARIAGRNDRLTTRFGRLVDVAREAAYLTSKSTEHLVTRERVDEAVRRSKRRADLPARKFRSRVADGTIHVETRGAVTGQVNGLAVLHAGPLTYGFPCRITATIGAGHAGTINIERESQLSGAIHTKGFYILGGLLRHLLQTRHPLAFSASIAFEQSYGGIDGDSASGAEMCCLLSALTGVPLRQDLAMTGAIDQHGRILPIGAATEKIEGFYDACVDLGLTGTQGVIVPRTNVGDLMLRADVVEACAAGRFAVHAVGTIHEALELFTGVAAGECDEDGNYPPDTLLGRAVERAGEFWRLATAGPRTAAEEIGAGTEDEPADAEDD